MRLNNVNKLPGKSIIKPLPNFSFPCLINAYPLTCPQLHLLESLGPFKPYIWSKPMCICVDINSYYPTQHCKAIPEISLDSYFQHYSTAADPQISSYFYICCNKIWPVSVGPESQQRGPGMDPSVVLLSFGLLMPAGTQLTLPTRPQSKTHKESLSVQLAVTRHFQVISNMAFAPPCPEGADIPAVVLYSTRRGTPDITWSVWDLWSWLLWPPLQLISYLQLDTYLNFYLFTWNSENCTASVPWDIN